jgi:apolipoprotein D and lipocalin family protein
MKRPMQPRSPLALFVLAGLIGLAGCTNMPNPGLHTVSRVDLPRYMGRWYVISNIPNFLENGKVATFDEYAPRPDGRIDVIYGFHKGALDAPGQRWKGVAWVTDAASQARWKVRLLWPFTSDYLVLELDPDYQWAVVGSNGGSLLWVLARQQSLPDTVYRDIQDRIAKQGLDPAKLVKVLQATPTATHP